MSTLKFKVSGVAVDGKTGVGDFFSDSVLMKYSHVWSVSVSETGTDGTPTFTIQGSNDDAKWYDYSAGATTVALAEGYSNDFWL